MHSTDLRKKIERSLRDVTGEGGALALLQLASKIVPMVARGALLRPRLGTRSSFPLVGRGVRIRNPQSISIGRGVVLEDFCEIQGRSRDGVRLGDNVTVGSFAMVRPSGYYGREQGEGLEVGANSNIGAYSYIGCSGKITIGMNVLMGPRVSLFAENHNFGDPSLRIKDQGVARSSIVINDDCWLGSGAIILAGVTVGQGAIVGAGSVVTHDVLPHSIVGGIPATQITGR